MPIVYTKILDVKIHLVNKKTALKRAEDFLLANTGQYKVYTPNPEFLVHSTRDSRFKEILNSSDLNICDGFGLFLASGGKLNRLPGVDFMLDLCFLADTLGVGLFLLGSGSDIVVNKTKEELQKRFPTLHIVGINSGPKIVYENGEYKINEQENTQLVDKINQSGAQIVFVAFGMGKQEWWITNSLTKIPKVKIAMGVGGSFDYLSGNIKRAPLFLRKIGLEWLYRLVAEPSRLKRIVDAVFVFPYYFLKDKLI